MGQKKVLDVGADIRKSLRAVLASEKRCCHVVFYKGDHQLPKAAETCFFWSFDGDTSRTDEIIKLILSWRQ